MAQSMIETGTQEASAAMPLERQSISVLIVAGDDVFLRIVHSFLERSDYRLLAAADGEEALSIARAEMPSLVVIDEGLPGVNAAETCRLLKAAAASSREEKPAVVVVCADSSEEPGGPAIEGAVDDAFADGADAVVTRPLDRNVFLRTLAELTEARPRRYFRLPAFVPASFCQNGRTPVAAGVRELSEGGAFVMTHEVLPPGSNIRLTLQLPPTGEVNCWAQVVTPKINRYSETSGLTDPGMGIRFLNLDDGGQQKVRDYVQRFLASAVLQDLRGAPANESEKSNDGQIPRALAAYLNGAANVQLCQHALRGDGTALPPGTGQYPAEPYDWEVDAARQAFDGESVVEPIASAAALRLVLEGWRCALLQAGVVPDRALDRSRELSRRLLAKVPEALARLRTVSRAGVGCVRPGEVALTRTRLYRAAIALRQVAAELNSDEDSQSEPWRHTESLRWAVRLKEAQEGPCPPELEGTTGELTPGEITALSEWDGGELAPDSGVFPQAAQLSMLGLRAWVDAYLHQMTIPLAPEVKEPFLEAASEMLRVAEASFRRLTRHVCDALAKSGGDAAAAESELSLLDTFRFGTARPVFALRDIYDLYRGGDDREVLGPFETAEAFHAACQTVERDGQLEVNAWALAGEYALPPIDEGQGGLGGRVIFASGDGGGQGH